MTITYPFVDPKPMSYLPDKIYSRICIVEDCWVWQGSVNGSGYGAIAWKYKEGWKYVGVHRLVYELLVGTITEETLHHICSYKLCCNPIHLVPMSHKDNISLGNAPSTVIARSGKCSRGHPFNSENTYLRSNGKRQCRVCARILYKARRPQ